MDSRCIRMRMNDCDRLSRLPDDLICIILSSFGIRHVIELSVLSSRWRYIWTSMTNLNISNNGFSGVRKFSKFLTRVLSLCNSQVKLTLDLRGKISQVHVQEVLRTISNNIQQLTFNFLRENPSEFPLSLFSSKSLKHLTLCGPTKGNYVPTPTSTWELPALTTLCLEHVTLCDDDKDKCVTLISKCTNLKNLTLKNCCIGSSTLTISHLQLSSLTLENWYWTLKTINLVAAINVIAPQLKNLSIRNCGGEHRVLAPNLTSLIYINFSFKLNVVDNLCLLEKVVLSVQNPSEAVAHKLVGLLHKFNNVKYFELSLEIIELLSANVNLLLHQPSPFVKLRRLWIFPLIFEEEGRMNVMSAEVKNYLLDSSSATLTMISREARRAVRDAMLAGNLMKELRVLLDKEKASMKCSNENRMQQPWMKMPPGVSQTQAQMKCYNENRMQQPLMEMPHGVSQIQAHIESCWSERESRIAQEKAKCKPVVSLLVQIEGLLTQLPVSIKAKLQPRFDSLFAEAGTVMMRHVDQGKYGHDLQRTRIQHCVLDLGKGSWPSSYRC